MKFLKNQTRTASQPGFSNPRVLLAFALCSVGALLAMAGLGAMPEARLIPGQVSEPGNVIRPDKAMLVFDPVRSSGIIGKGAALPSDPGYARQPAPAFFNGNAKQATATSPVAPAGASGWSIVDSPNPAGPQNNVLPGVSCISANDCWAVGYSFVSSLAIRTLTEHWDGTSWSVVASANTNNTQDNALYGVVCASANECWAVGYYDASFSGSAFQTLIERWDGNSWTIVSSPDTSATQDNVLVGVTCTSVSDCWAVGYYRNNAFSPSQTLVEHWNGASWTIIPSPNNNAPANAVIETNALIGVTCTSASACWAAGYYYDVVTGVYQTLIERWDGSSWSIAISANTLPTERNVLSGVSCTSASDCWAIGYYFSTANGFNQTLIEHWDGTLWTAVSSPDSSSSQTNFLNGLVCASANNCWAVGDYYTGSAYQTLVERWDGSSWTIVASPDTSPAQHNILYGIACASTSGCWSVGYYDNGNVDQTLVEHWNGVAWSITSSANPLTTQSNILNAVACVSSSDCWTAGYYISGSNNYKTLIEHWDGTNWSLIDSPDPTSVGTTFLNGIGCSSASDCWAVGQSSPDITNGSPYQTLVEHWDGNSWTIVSSPDADTTKDNALNAVTCASPSQCWAVGNPGLLEKWDGVSWSLLPFSQSDATLTAVTCRSTSDCWAAGYSSATVTAHWDGNAWTIIPSPNQPSANNYLLAITCASASECWTVGDYYSGNPTQTLIERWDGASWLLVNSPNTSPSVYNQLNGTGCASASDCWAVGSAFPVTTPEQTLAEHWNGASWNIVPSADSSPAQNNILNAVTCTPTSECWAVGYYVADGIARTLIEHYTPPPPVQLSAVVSRKVHGSAGTFDVDLTTGNGIECRSGGPNGNYTLVFTFANTLTSVGSASVASGTGSVASSSIDSNDAHNFIVNLTGVTNAQVITVSLTNVNDSAGDSSSILSASMGVLVGDTTANGLVNSSDISQTKAQSGNAATSSNFREDVTVSGLINSSDISLVKSKSGTALP